MTSFQLKTAEDYVRENDDLRQELALCYHKIAQQRFRIEQLTTPETKMESISQPMGIEAIERIYQILIREDFKMILKLQNDLAEANRKKERYKRQLSDVVATNRKRSRTRIDY